MQEFRAEFEASGEDIAIVNIRQNVAHAGRSMSPIVPALLTRSYLFLLRKEGVEREMLPLEHWSAQGWVGPTVLARMSAAAASFNIDLATLQSMTLAALRHIAGNGMHKVVVGSIELFVLCAMAKRVRGDK